MGKILLMLISALILISSGFSLEESERRYEEKVSKKANEIRNLPFDKLLEIFRNPKEEYYVRNAALRVLKEYKKKEIINDIIKVKEEEKGKCRALPISIHEFRPVCVFDSNLSKAAIEIELDGLSLKEKIHIWMSYQKYDCDVYDYCSKKGDKIDECMNSFEEFRKREIYSGGSYLMLFDTKFDSELIREMLKYKDDKNDYLRGLVIDLLNRNIESVILEDLIYFLSDSYWVNRMRAIHGIEKLGDKRAIPYLKKILENKKEDEKVRKAAQEAIEKISGGNQ